MLEPLKLVVFFARDESECPRFTTKNASGIALLTKSVNNLERFTPHSLRLQR